MLEDDKDKKSAIEAEIISVSPSIALTHCITFSDFMIAVQREKYDLIILDLLVPLFDQSSEPQDAGVQIVDVLHDRDCVNSRTPAIALTSFDQAAEGNFKDLNQLDVSVITYFPSGIEWKEALHQKILSCMPPENYDFVIICALPKEAKGFCETKATLGGIKIVDGFRCQELAIGSNKGVVITLSRMGLVSAAIISSRAIDRFKPKIICMSGICAGIDGKAEIYDVVVADPCHQHDHGKWGADGFELEPYAVQIPHSLRLKIETLLDDKSFMENIKNGINLARDEYPADKNEFEFGVIIAPASSGSAVIADDEKTSEVREQHRKATAFEMESFAVYEAARISQGQPVFFSAKSVVDDGGKGKSDHYHRVACILSARTTVEILENYLALDSK
ncbi:5'-methylthioadenosine/S-adenosylhomocysteine nucleosidase family protein [Pseudomonas xanthosomatis]|uniref:5'-methylthioadenosine/S-adenosylhomocysteine nucleosidase family protein n=1 Tax=Pseudomonas xanthosomatis TaxID=2842356 RepID=UPI001CEDD956|nr:nucleoside phosphorylase [Pseudomonas xanthosomatis]